MAFLKILFYLIVLIAVLVLAYYTTRMLGRGMGRTRGTGGNGDSGPDGTGP
mgnify:CR=1 FL=1